MLLTIMKLSFIKTILHCSNSALTFCVRVILTILHYISGSQTFWSQSIFTHLTIVEDPKELLFMWVRTINIYHIIY